MSGRHRTFRFNHPEVDIGTPGFLVRPGGGLSMVDEAASVRQAIFLLLSTEPGERVMRPDYGCDIHRLVFSKNDDTTAGLAMHAVKTALLRWEPRIELLSVDASPSPEAPSRLDIQVGYRLKSTGQRDTLDYVLSLEGGA